MFVIGAGNNDFSKVAQAWIVMELIVRTVTGVEEFGDAISNAIASGAEQMKNQSEKPLPSIIGDYRLGAAGLKDAGIVLTLAHKES